MRNRYLPKDLVNTKYTYLRNIQGMEHTGFEPVTPTLPVWCAPSCANAPDGGDGGIRTHGAFYCSNDFESFSL